MWIFDFTSVIRDIRKSYLQYIEYITYKYTPSSVCSAQFSQSGDGWSQPDQRFQRADEILVCCMLIGCLFWRRPFRSIIGEHGEDVHHAIGCTDCFKQMEGAVSNPSGAPTLPPIPTHTSGLMWQNQSRCDSAPLFCSSRGPKFIGLNKDPTKRYSLHFQTGSGAI